MCVARICGDEFVVVVVVVDDDDDVDVASSSCSFTHFAALTVAMQVS